MRSRCLVSLSLVGLILVSLPARTRDAQAQQVDYLERARALHREVPLIDGHNDYPWQLRQRAGYDLSKLDIRGAQPAIHTDIPRLRQGGLGGQFWSVYVPADLQGEAAVSATLEQVDAVLRMINRYPDVFEQALTADDVERIFRTGRIASMMGMEGGHSINASLGTLRMFYQLGVRYMTLTHSANVPWADSATDDPKLGGLSPFGEEVVREMNRIGMLVDISHVSPDTMKDAIRVSEAPIIFSHSAARGVTDHPRNVPDDVLRLVQKNGGVVMVIFLPSYIAPEGAEYYRREAAEQRRLRGLFPNNARALQAEMAKWRKTNPVPVATIAQVADHIDHIRRVAGIDHLGLGSDYDGMTAPAAMPDVTSYPHLTAELLRRGYSNDDIKKVLGLNVLRVMREAEKVAARLQKERPVSTATIEKLDAKTN